MCKPEKRTIRMMHTPAIGKAVEILGRTQAKRRKSCAQVTAKVKRITSNVRNLDPFRSGLRPADQYMIVPKDEEEKIQIK